MPTSEFYYQRTMEVVASCLSMETKKSHKPKINKLSSDLLLRRCKQSLGEQGRRLLTFMTFDVKVMFVSIPMGDLPFAGVLHPKSVRTPKKNQSVLIPVSFFYCQSLELTHQSSVQVFNAHKSHFGLSD